VEYRSGVSISKGKNVAQMAAKKSNGGVFGAVQFRQCLVDNGVDGQVADDYMAVRRAKKGVLPKQPLRYCLTKSNATTSPLTMPPSPALTGTGLPTIMNGCLNLNFNTLMALS